MASTDTVYLKRKVNLLGSVCLIVGTVVGSGIFIAPKGVLRNSGNVGMSLVVWLATGLLSTFGALCYAELGTSIKKSGGHYIYLLETLGPMPAFLRLWAQFILIRPAASSVVALAFGRYIVEPFFSPCSAPTLLVKMISIIGVSFAVAVNCWSVTLTTRLQIALTTVKMGALGLIIVPGMIKLGSGQTENFDSAFDTSSLTLDKLPLAFYAGLYAYAGWYVLNYVTEEVIDSKRNIPLSIILSMVTVTISYLLTNISYYTVMTSQDVLESNAVAVTFADRALQGFSSVIPVLVAVSCLGSLLGSCFTTPRMLFSGSREGQWPILFAMIHIRRHTPLPAVLIMYPMIVFMILAGELFGLLNFYSFSRWLFMGLTTMGLMVHRYRNPDLPRPFKILLFVEDDCPASFCWTRIC
ncbi:cystine/glutamate transporter-like isoform X3 [Erpetoichthys calabaricus]|uniref:cystine/glutamate transporter-like isoform X3 n=1 Tax=Erpetoichthys calabaricus TaxID=27687 RepID=UPI002234D5ED|nr:cystine/glutamate transporter-like isoform X3 [Erpetoichthys calabaricus]